MRVASGNSCIARRAHDADPIASTDSLTFRHFYPAEVGKVVTHVVIANEGDRLAAAGARSIKFFHPFVDRARLGNCAGSWCEHMGVTTIYVDGRVVNVVAWVGNCNFGEWKNIEDWGSVICNQTLRGCEERCKYDDCDNTKYLSDALPQLHICDRSVAAPNVTVEA